MISDDTQIDLIINKLTRAQYQALSLSGLIDENQLYMITDDPTVPQIVSSMISSYYPKTETSSASEISVKFNDLSNYYTKSETSSAENLKTKFDTLSTYAEISAQLSNDGYLISASLSSYYPKTETSSAAELSSAFDKKVLLGTYVSGVGYSLSSSNLSVVRIDNDEYYKMVALSTIDPNVVYILSSGIVNGQGERIINVGEPVSADDAATKGYVDENACATFVGDYSTESYDLQKRDLSIARIALSDYLELIDKEALISDMMYVVRSENLDACYQRVINVEAPISAYDAVNKAYLDERLENVTTRYQMLTKTLVLSSVSIEGVQTQALTCQADDSAINTIQVSANTYPVYVYLPLSVDGARDFLVRVECLNSSIPSIGFFGSNGESVSFESVDDEWATLETGVNLFNFTETRR